MVPVNLQLVRDQNGNPIAHFVTQFGLTMDARELLRTLHEGFPAEFNEEYLRVVTPKGQSGLILPNNVQGRNRISPMQGSPEPPEFNLDMNPKTDGKSPVVDPPAADLDRSPD